MLACSPQRDDIPNCITVEQAQARGLHLVCTDPAKGIVVHAGDIITHTASGVDLKIVDVLNEYQALARALRPRRRRLRGALGQAEDVERRGASVH